MPDAPEPRQVESWFARRGLSTLLRGTQYQADVSTRAVPVLLVILALMMFVVVPDLTASWGWTALISLGVLAVGWIVGNLVRRRPPFAPVQRVGWPEGTAFVLLPTMAVLLGPHQDLVLAPWRIDASVTRVLAAGAVAVVQILLLLIVLLSVRLGVIKVGNWLVRETLLSLSSSGVALGRALPLLLGVVTFFFFAADVWQSIGLLASYAYLATALLFLGLSAVFLTGREHLGLEELATFRTQAEFDEALAQTPLANATVPIRQPVRVRLSATQDRILRMTFSVSRLTMAILVGAMVFAFFVVLGALTIDAGVVKLWTAQEPAVIAQVATSRHTYILSWEHLRVAGFVGVFSAFYFAVVSVTSPEFRAGLSNSTHEAVRQGCAARLAIDHHQPTTGRASEPAPAAAPGGAQEVRKPPKGS